MNRDKDTSKDISIDTSKDIIRYVPRDKGGIYSICPCVLEM
nr:MAG TPA: hypothetical protein [Caudoviricetes sp.]